ncbi:hypothetical protein GCM10023075_07800 [Streptosporangium album]
MDGVGGLPLKETPQVLRHERVADAHDLRGREPGGDLHGLDRVAWLVAAFTLGATAMLPLYGRLCDVLGAKQVYLAAIPTAEQTNIRR